MRRTRSEQKVPSVHCTRLVRRLGKHSHPDESRRKSTGAGNKRRCPAEEEAKGGSIHRRLNQHAPCTGGVAKVKGNVVDGSQPTACHGRPAIESSSNTAGSPVSKKCALRRTGQSSLEEHNDSVDVGLVQTDDTDSDSDIVVINKSHVSNRDITKARQRTVGDHQSAHASKRYVRSQNGVLDIDDDTEHDTTEGQLISSASDVDDSSEDSEVILRGFSVESSSDVTSASSTRKNLKIIQLETELRQAKKTTMETVSKKDEVIRRLQNRLKWKDEQMEGMNELVNKNMLLEAKLRESVGQKENDEIKRLQNIKWKDKQIEGMNELSNRNMELETRIKAMQGDKKNEVIERLQNNLKWKEEQIEGMNELVNRNMELEARIKEILGDKKAYKKEVEKAERERTERETRQKVEDKESESSATVSRRVSLKCRTPSNEAHTSKDSSKDSSKDISTPCKDTRMSSKDKGTHTRMDTNTPGKDTRTPSKDTGTPTSRSQKGLRCTRQRKGTIESGDMDDIDKLFIESDVEGKDIDDKVEQREKTTGKGDKKKVEEKPKEKVEKQGKSSGKQENEKEKKEEEEEEEGDDDSSQHKGRKQIHKLLKGQKLLGETKAAAKAEKVRRERLKKEREQHLVVTEKDPKTKQTITTRLVLAFKKGTKSPLVEVNQRLVRRMKPHQVEAVEFLWDNLIESVDHLKSDDPGQGCILAHCMGLGKTLSVIGLVHTLLCSRAVSFKRCLVVCPLNTVLNWQHEWQKWLDKKDRLTVHELASSRNNHERVIKLQKWQKSGGVMIMGYQIFRILSSYSGRSKKTKTIFAETLIDPGPDIVVCDEGHILKNDASAISKSMNRIRTKKRVILTGTPLQNNLTEYHCMVSFVKPNLLGTRREFSNRFVNPITNGQHSDSTAADVRLMKRRAHVLHEMLDACVQRRDYSALTKFLPPKHEYVIAVRLSPLQVALYRKYLELHVQMQEDGSVVKGASLFSDYQNLMRIWTHPWVLRLDEIRQEKRAVYESDDDPDLLETSEEEEMEEDEEEEGEVTVSSAEESSDARSASDDKMETRTNRTRKGRKASTDENESKEEDSDSDVPGGKKAKIVAGEVIRSWKSSTRGTKFDDGFASLQQKKEKAWWSSFVNEEQHKNCVELSGKLVLLFQIVKLAEQLGDKVLLFSQSLLTLDLIEHILASKTEETEKKQKGKGSRKMEKGKMWVKEKDYLRMDGATDPQQRKRFTNAFNDSKQTRLRLFLISTRAGGLGINLERANRVIIFDASWNPSHDIQSIFRVYRFGQTKPVYVYRFLAQGTMEEKIYERQVTKETLSQRVVDEHQIDRHFTAHDLQELYWFTPDQVDAPDRTLRPTPVVPKDVVLAELLSGSREWIVQYHEHDSLLVNHPEEDLSEEERQAAWDEYEKEKQGLYAYPNMVMGFPGMTGKPPIVGPSIGPGTGPMPGSQPPPAALANTTMQLLTTQHPKLNFQIAQLPRVVQEILKYNPNITAQELQSRLQAFLGMNARYSVPGHAMGPTSSQGVTTSQPVSEGRSLLSTVTKSSTPSIVAGPSGMTVTPRMFLPGTSLVNLPSRLPAPGNVPAMSQQK